jgi:hypothetical protein
MLKKLRREMGPSGYMKFAPDRPYSDPEEAARKLLEIANAVDAMQDGRLKKGSLALLTSVGAGFTVGAVLVRWAI